MDKCVEYLTHKLDLIGYEQTHLSGSSDFVWLNFQLKPHIFRTGGSTVQFHVVYVKHPIDAERIRNLFNTHRDPILIVVDSSLIDNRSVNFDMFRALHAMYKGRVYAWDGAGVIGVHHERQSGKTTTSGYIEFSMKFENTECWYKGFPGQYHVAKFNDRAFWKPGTKPEREPPPAEQSYEEFMREHFDWSEQQPPKSNPKQDEHFRRQQAERDERKRRAEQGNNAEDLNEEIRRKFNEYMRNAQGGGEQDQEPVPPMWEYFFNQEQRPQWQTWGNEWAKPKPSGDQWVNQMMAAGSKDGAKMVYRKLGRQYHPDVNKEPQATAIMQAINDAYRKVMDYYGD